MVAAVEALQEAAAVERLIRCLRCMSCNYQITLDALEDWLYMQLADTTHLLHGVVHVNVYGHLLRINGREGGSKFLSGCHIMDFWDRLCQMLRVSMHLSAQNTYQHLRSDLDPPKEIVEMLLLNDKVQSLEESSAKVANIQQVIMDINALSKVFNEQLVTANCPGIGIMFKQGLWSLLLLEFPLLYLIKTFLNCLLLKS